MIEGGLLSDSHPASHPWLGGFEFFSYVLIRNMIIHFRCADTSMSKHRLDIGDWSSSFYHVRRETMSESMGSDRLSSANRGAVPLNR